MFEIVEILSAPCPGVCLCQQLAAGVAGQFQDGRAFQCRQAFQLLLFVVL